MLAVLHLMRHGAAVHRLAGERRRDVGGERRRIRETDDDHPASSARRSVES
ncbi:MAG TPA: hypothetical protein VNN07_08475 [Candidatus Tectomicrobia bacterium]|nr:hypothetical protein [Candidatus Tectomicrobia bacterium]